MTGKQLEISTPAQNHRSDDEIDLRELFQALWQGKLTIIACTLIFAIVSVIYALNAQQWWTSKALVTIPKVADIEFFNKAVKRYQPAFDLYQKNGDSQEGSELDALTSQEKIFYRFIENFNANYNKREFFKQSDMFKQLLEDEYGAQSVDDTVYRMAVKQWLTHFNASALNKNESNRYLLSVESSSNTSSLALLNEYIIFIKELVLRDLMQDLNATLLIKRNEIEQILESRLLLAEQQLKIEITKAEKALEIAEAAKIRRPVENLNKDEIFSIELGADAIREKVNILKKFKDLSLIDENIVVLNSRLSVLDRKLPTLEKIDFFSYLEKPVMPLQRNGQSNITIILLGIVLGFMLGIVVLVVRFLLLNKN